MQADEQSTTPAPAPAELPTCEHSDPWCERCAQRWLRARTLPDPAEAQRALAALIDTFPSGGVRLSAETIDAITATLDDRDGARAELARLRPVVDAARAFGPATLCTCGDPVAHHDEQHGFCKAALSDLSGPCPCMNFQVAPAAVAGLDRTTNIEEVRRG